MTTREKILQTALVLFAKQGIDKTSTSQITKKVGVAEGTLFVHFKTKQALVDALYLSIKKDGFSDLATHIDTKKSVEKNVKQIAKAIILYFVNHYDAFVFMELVEHDPQVSKETILSGREYYTELSSAVTRWQKQGAFKEVDMQTLQHILWNLIIVIIRTMKKKRRKTVSKVHLDVIWEAIRK